jgi:hypothetical protein
LDLAAIGDEQLSDQAPSTKKKKEILGGRGRGRGRSVPLPCRAVPRPAPPGEGGRGRRKRAYQRDGGDEGVRCGEGEEGGVLPVGRLVDVVPPAAESRRRRGGRRGGGGAGGGGGGEGGGELPHLVRGQGNGGRRRRSSSRYRPSSLLPISPPLHRFGVREEGTRRGRKGSHEGGWAHPSVCDLAVCAWGVVARPAGWGPVAVRFPILYYIMQINKLKKLGRRVSGLRCVPAGRWGTTRRRSPPPPLHVCCCCCCYRLRPPPPPLSLSSRHVTSRHEEEEEDKGPHLPARHTTAGQ